jgi:hypothetical protein
MMTEVTALEYRNRIMDEYGDNLSRAWVQYANIGKVRTTVLVTLFPKGNSGYRMAFSKEVTSVDWSTIRNLVESILDTSN